MITSFFNSGKGAGSGIYYLTEKREPEAKVLRGDIDAQVQLIDSLDFKQRYLSGVHRFIESDIPDSTKNEIMDSFENMMFAGLSEEQKPPVLWVQHQEKGGTELHFIIPEVEMGSGKKFSPFWHETDLKMVDAWKNTVNYEHDLTDPNEPSRIQTLTIPKNLPRSHKQAVEKIDEAITGMVNSGDIKNRDDVISTLENSGFEVVRKTKQFISIKADGWKKPARLKGAFYGESFRGVDKLRETIERKGIEFREGAGERYKSSLECYTKELEKRAKRIRAKYKRHDRGSEKETKKTHSFDTTLESTLDDLRGIDSIKYGSNVLRKDSNEWNHRGARKSGTDRAAGGKDTVDPMQASKRQAKAVRESSGNPTIQGWLQAVKVKAGEINDRVRETFNRWYRDLNDRVRETNHQFERAGAIELSTGRRIGSQNRNIDATIRQNKHAHSTLEVALKTNQIRKREQSQGWSR